MCIVVLPVGFIESMVGLTSMYSKSVQLAIICCTRFDTTIWPNWITQSGFNSYQRACPANSASYVEITTLDVSHPLTFDKGSAKIGACKASPKEQIVSASSISICGPARIRIRSYLSSKSLISFVPSFPWAISVALLIWGKLFLLSQPNTLL